MSRIHGHRLIEAAEVVDALPMGNTIATERQARALAPIKDDPALMAWVTSSSAQDRP